LPEYRSMTRLAQTLRRLCSHPLARRRSVLIIAAVTLLGIVLDLFVGDVNRWFSSHQFATAVLAEALLLGLAVFGIDFLTERADERRWLSLALAPLLQLALRVDGVSSALMGAKYLQDAGRPLHDITALVESTYEKLDRAMTEFAGMFYASPYLAELYALAVECQYEAKNTLIGLQEREEVSLAYDRYAKAARELTSRYLDVSSAYLHPQLKPIGASGDPSGAPGKRPRADR